MDHEAREPVVDEMVAVRETSASGVVEREYVFRKRDSISNIPDVISGSAHGGRGRGRGRPPGSQNKGKQNIQVWDLERGRNGKKFTGTEELLLSK